MMMNHKKAAFRMLFLIAKPKLVTKAVKLFKERNIPAQYVFHAQGTASSEIMDMLGLDRADKHILMSMMPKGFADEILKKLREWLHLGMPNTGIAFTVAISGANSQMIQLIEKLEPEEKRKLSERSETEKMNNEYSMIMVIVNQGFSEEVMNAAKSKGASGGTVFHSRRVGNIEVMRFWKISVQEEREIVLILARKENKLEIMQEIGKECGINSKAQGVVMSLPVDSVVGLDGY